LVFAYFWLGSFCARAWPPLTLSIHFVAIIEMKTTLYIIFLSLFLSGTSAVMTAQGVACDVGSTTEERDFCLALADLKKSRKLFTDERAVYLLSYVNTIGNRNMITQFDKNQIKLATEVARELLLLDSSTGEWSSRDFKLLMYTGLLDSMVVANNTFGLSELDWFKYQVDNANRANIRIKIKSGDGTPAGNVTCYILKYDDCRRMQCLVSGRCETCPQSSVNKMEAEKYSAWYPGTQNPIELTKGPLYFFLIRGTQIVNCYERLIVKDEEVELTF
jgi:hypothetical protein